MKEQPEQKQTRKLHFSPTIFFVFSGDSMTSSYSCPFLSLSFLSILFSLLRLHLVTSRSRGLLLSVWCFLLLKLLNSLFDPLCVFSRERRPEGEGNLMEMQEPKHLQLQFFSHWIPNGIERRWPLVLFVSRYFFWRQNLLLIQIKVCLEGNTFNYFLSVN